ncbi:MAG: hypothetical protein K0R65_907 [Crocinitomicaceae bacterium]|jgi:uncharacterized protein (DUF1015 family)|nr:hypothetical protein [Crocinitomicaceae bacterium]
MAKLKPFKAIRPTRDKAHLVATRPVYTYRKSILKAKLEENPYTFIRIINPEYKEEVKTRPNSRERFLNVKHQFELFCEAGILIQDKEEHLYLYRQTKNDHAFVGIIAGASVDEYDRDLVKKHEATLTSREEMFTNYLDLVGFNAEPVLLSYPKNDGLNALYEKIMQDRPEYEFSTTDLVKHELWLVNKEHEKQVLELFDKIPEIYIADGHHRSASSARLAEKYRSNPAIKTENHNYFLAFLMDDSRMKILEFNRLVKSLKGLGSQAILDQLSEHFTVEKLDSAQKPQKEHEITMNLRSEWYKLTCKPETVNDNHPVACLDAEILTQYILTPLLGIKDLKTDSNIEFISGNLGIEAISDPIANQKAELGFVLYPITMEQVKRVADNHLIMPPKSTWVEPKLRSGLTIYNIKE